MHGGTRRLWLFGGGLLGLWAVTAVGVYAWARSDSAFERWVMNRGARGDGQASFAEVEAKLQSLHHGPLPCLRHLYTDRSDGSTLRPLAEELLALGLGPEEVAGLLGQFLLWSEERESAAHEKPAADELAEMLGEGRPLTRLVLRVQLHRLEEALIARPGEVHEAGRATYGALTPSQQRAVRNLWERNPQPFTLSSLVPLLDAMKGRVTAGRLDALSRTLRDRFDRGELDEVRLEALAREAGVPAEDGWGSAFSLSDEGGQSVWLRSHAYVGDPEELSREVRRPGAPNAGARTETSAGKDCGGAPGQVALARADLHAALDDVDALARSARVVPALFGGVVHGFKVFSIRPNSLLDRVGLCDGDLVRHVNGFALTSPERALAVYAVVREASEVRVELVRGGAPQTLHVQVR